MRIDEKELFQRRNPQRREAALALLASRLTRAQEGDMLDDVKLEEMVEFAIYLADRLAHNLDSTGVGAAFSPDTLALDREQSTSDRGKVPLTMAGPTLEKCFEASKAILADVMNMRSFTFRIGDTVTQETWKELERLYAMMVDLTNGIYHLLEGSKSAAADVTPGKNKR